MGWKMFGKMAGKYGRIGQVGGLPRTVERGKLLLNRSNIQILSEGDV
jgi:hypothetical protein